MFFVPTGLGDHNLEVRKHMLNAALKAVNDHGKVCTKLLTCFKLLALHSFKKQETGCSLHCNIIVLFKRYLPGEHITSVTSI